MLYNILSAALSKRGGRSLMIFFARATRGLTHKKEVKVEAQVEQR